MHVVGIWALDSGLWVLVLAPLEHVWCNHFIAMHTPRTALFSAATEAAAACAAAAASAYYAPRTTSYFLCMGNICINIEHKPTVYKRIAF